MKTALITGASTGIGYATAKALKQKGWRVLAGARKETDLTKLKHELGVEPIELDVTNQQHIESLKSTLKETLRDNGLDALINNAGIARIGPWECMEMDHIREGFEVNVFGLLSVTQVALPYIRKARGRVVNVSSIAGRAASGFMGPYSASKFAVEAITDSLRRELAPTGVKVISINPGPIDTEIWSKGDTLEVASKRLFKNQDQSDCYSKGALDFFNKAQKAQKEADPVEWVVKAMLHALESSRPKTRYYVGKGMKMAATLSNHLPDRILDRLM